LYEATTQEDAKKALTELSDLRRSFSKLSHTFKVDIARAVVGNLVKLDGEEQLNLLVGLYRLLPDHIMTAPLVAAAIDDDERKRRIAMLVLERGANSAPNIAGEIFDNRIYRARKEEAAQRSVPNWQDEDYERWSKVVRAVEGSASSKPAQRSELRNQREMIPKEGPEEAPQTVPIKEPAPSKPEPRPEPTPMPSTPKTPEREPVPASLAYGRSERSTKPTVTTSPKLAASVESQTPEDIDFTAAVQRFSDIAGRPKTYSDRVVEIIHMIGDSISRFAGRKINPVDLFGQEELIMEYIRFTDQDSRIVSQPDLVSQIRKELADFIEVKDGNLQLSENGTKALLNKWKSNAAFKEAIRDAKAQYFLKAADELKETLKEQRNKPLHLVLTGDAMRGRLSDDAGDLYINAYKQLESRRTYRMELSNQGELVEITDAANKNIFVYLESLSASGAPLLWGYVLMVDKSGIGIRVRRLRGVVAGAAVSGFRDAGAGNFHYRYDLPSKGMTFGRYFSVQTNESGDQINLLIGKLTPNTPEMGDLIIAIDSSEPVSFITSGRDSRSEMRSEEENWTFKKLLEEFQHADILSDDRLNKLINDSSLMLSKPSLTPDESNELRRARLHGLLKAVDLRLSATNPSPKRIRVIEYLLQFAGFDADELGGKWYKKLVDRRQKRIKQISRSEIRTEKVEELKALYLGEDGPNQIVTKFRSLFVFKGDTEEQRVMNVMNSAEYALEFLTYLDEAYEWAEDQSDTDKSAQKILTGFPELSLELNNVLLFLREKAKEARSQREKALIEQLAGSISNRLTKYGGLKLLPEQKGAIDAAVSGLQRDLNKMAEDGESPTRSELRKGTVPLSPDEQKGPSLKKPGETLTVTVSSGRSDSRGQSPSEPTAPMSELQISLNSFVAGDIKAGEVAGVFRGKDENQLNGLLQNFAFELGNQLGQLRARVTARAIMTSLPDVFTADDIIRAMARLADFSGTSLIMAVNPALRAVLENIAVRYSTQEVPSVVPGGEVSGTLSNEDLNELFQVSIQQAVDRIKADEKFEINNFIYYDKAFGRQLKEYIVRVSEAFGTSARDRFHLQLIASENKLLDEFMSEVNAELKQRGLSEIPAGSRIAGIRHLDDPKYARQIENAIESRRRAIDPTGKKPFAIYLMPSQVAAAIRNTALRQHIVQLDRNDSLSKAYGFILVPRLDPYMNANAEISKDGLLKFINQNSLEGYGISYSSGILVMVAELEKGLMIERQAQHARATAA
jgi:hypothetical protein